MSHPYDLITAASLWQQGHIKWQHDGVIGAWIAEMDFPLAEPIAAALRHVADDALTGYLPAWAEQELREASAGFLASRYSWQVGPGAVRALTDGLSGFDVAIEQFSAPGSAVIVPTPNYMPFLTRPGLLGREIVTIPMLPDGGRWRFDLAAIAQAFAQGAGTLVLTSPHNPVGQVYRTQELAGLADVVEAAGGRVFADEIHAPLVYPGARHVPYAAVSEVAASHCLTLISAAKAWNIPGLKCAQAILTAPGDLERWDGLGLSERNAPSTPGVLANTAAYRDGAAWLAGTLSYLQSNRDLLADLIKATLPGVSCPPIEGTYLAFVDLTPLGLGEPAAGWLEREAKVQVTPGPECGADSDQVIRFNFAMPAPVLRQAFEQIGEALSRR